MGAKLIGVGIILLGIISNIGDAQLRTRRSTAVTTEASPTTQSNSTNASVASTTIASNASSGPAHFFSYSYQVHSCLQMIGWCTFAAIGFFIEVHYPIVFQTRRGFELKLSGIFQLASMIFALAGIIVLIVMEGFSTNWGSHKILGITAMLIRLLGSFMMCIKPRNGAPKNKYHALAARARIVLTRSSYFLALATVFTGIFALFGDLTVPVWTIVLLSSLIALDAVIEAILFIHAFRAAEKSAETQKLLARDSEFDNNSRRGSIKDALDPAKLQELRTNPMRTGLTAFYAVSAIAITIAVIAGAIYYNPNQQG